MGLCPVLGCCSAELVLVLEPDAIGMDEQRPVIPEAVNRIPCPRPIGSILVVDSVELGKDVVPLEGMLLFDIPPSVSVGNLHSVCSDS